MNPLAAPDQAPLCLVHVLDIRTNSEHKTYIPETPESDMFDFIQDVMSLVTMSAFVVAMALLIGGM